jgi:hypothetical protein
MSIKCVSSPKETGYDYLRTNFGGHCICVGYEKCEENDSLMISFTIIFMPMG